MTVRIKKGFIKKAVQSEITAPLKNKTINRSNITFHFQDTSWFFPDF